MSMHDSRFRKLTNSPNWPEAQRMIMDGLPPARVADFLYDECGEYHEIKKESLVRSIIRFKKALEPGKLVSPYVMRRVDSELEIGLDVLRELEKILLLQLDRVEQGRELEKKMGLILPTLGQEVERALKELRAYVATLQSLGLQPKVPDQLMVASMVVGAPKELPAPLLELGRKQVGLLLELERSLHDNEE